MTGCRSCWWPSAVLDIIRSTSSTLMEESLEPVAASRPGGGGGGGGERGEGNSLILLCVYWVRGEGDSSCCEYYLKPTFNCGTEI